MHVNSSLYKSINSIFVCSILVRALATFMDSVPGGAMPLAGTIPDMTATTDNYVALQQIYHSEAREDRIKLKAIVIVLLQVCEKTIDPIAPTLCCRIFVFNAVCLCLIKNNIDIWID